MTLLGNSKT